MFALMRSLVKLVEAASAATTLEERIAVTTELLEHVHSSLTMIIFGRIRMEADAKNIYQEALFAISQKLHTCSSTEDRGVLAWCKAIARRKVADFFRQRYRDEKTFEFVDMEFLSQVADEAADAGRMAAEDREETEHTLRLLHALKAECQALLRLYFFEDMSYDDIARALGVAYDTALRRFQRCMKRAADLLGAG